ncbi:MAG: tetratricopeptide repeat protein, partial [Bacteroidota bacterium]
FPRERPEHLVLIGLWIAYLAHRSAPYIPKPIAITIPQQMALGLGTLAMAASLYVGYYRWQGETALIDIIRHKESGNYAAMLNACNAAYSPFYTVDNNAQPIRWYRGIAEFQLGNVEAALADFLEAETTHPYNMHVLNNTGAALIQLGRPAEAIPYLERSIQVNPRMDDARFNMAIAFKALGDVGTAVHYLNQTTVNPQRKQQLLRSMGY